MVSSKGWDIPLPESIKPWHVGAAALGVLAVYMLTRRSSTPTKPIFSGPPEDYTRLDVSEEAGCDLTEKPGTDYFRRYVMAYFGGSDKGILRNCGIGGNSGHKLGTSWDWGIDTGTADVDGLLRFLFANDNEMIRRAGIMYFIYNGHIWNTRAQTWQRYTGTDPHTDHIHFTFGRPGAFAQTSFYQQGQANA